MKILLALIGLMLLESCSSISGLNKNKFKNVGSVLVYTNSNDSISRTSNDTNSILTRQVELGTLLNRRIYNNSSGRLFAILIDSARNSYIEASIVRHDDTSVAFHVYQTPLNKKDSFEFDISYNTSVLKRRDFRKLDNDSYDLNFSTENKDTLKTFKINKTKNFVIQEGLLELMSGEILNPENNKVKFIVINDLHDVFESLTGLCFISIPNMALLRIQCKEISRNVKCPPGLKPISVVVTRDYFIAQNYFCQIDCK